MAGETKIKDADMIRMVNAGESQAAIARKYNVSGAAVCKRLKELRGKTTHAIVVSKIDSVIEQKIDTWKQLEKINQRANVLLDQAEGDVQESALMMREIREQLKLQMELFKTMWDVRAAMEFQDTVMTVIGKIDPEVRKKILSELNAKSAIRNAVTFR